ncbi:MAG: AAA family ATPase [Deltaproteobacteria bacterium]|nr:AAA family ATPase [Deltaproteobacteria bacterium]
MTFNVDRARTFAERFVAHEILKDAEGVLTFRGSDSETGADVVIKTAPREGATLDVARRLSREAPLLRGLARGNVSAPLIHFGTDNGNLFVVTPFIVGETLRERLSRGPLSIHEALTVAGDVLRRLDEAHAVGVVHRDVKPENIVLSAAASGLKAAALIDFGLTRSHRFSGWIAEAPAVMLRYVSPELAGLLDRGVDSRSDLYSLGAVLFESLSGRPPFASDDAGALLRAHLLERPPAIRSLNDRVPRALEAVLARLLRKDPRDRYQSAAAVLRDLSEIESRLATGDVDPDVAVGQGDRRSTLTEPTFIGRERELAGFDAALAEAAGGDGGAVLLEAESGGGKSWLLDEMALHAAGRRAWALRGRATTNGAARPYQILLDLLREVVRAARTDEALAERLRQSQGDDRTTVVRAIPELAEILGGVFPPDESLSGGEAHGERRVERALARFLDALGTAARPAVIMLDDVQWVDEAAVRFLQRWAARDEETIENVAGAPLGRDRHVLVVLSFRTEEVPPTHRLRAIAPLLALSLAPFGPIEMRSLVESMAGRVPDEVHAVVSRLSEGRPFLAVGVLQGLVEARALAPGADGWEVQEDHLADLRTSRHAATFLSERLNRMPEGVLRFLSVAAVIGREFDIDLAADVAAESAANVQLAVEEARQRHVIWKNASGTRGTFVHDKLREALLERWSDDARRALHGEIAERIERLDPDRVFEVAFHFDRAGATERALPFALSAAEKARAQHALTVAEQNYRIAAKAVAGAQPRDAFRSAEGLGSVLMMQASYAESFAYLERARTLAPSSIERVRIEGLLSELAFKRGDVESAAKIMTDSIRALGHPVPRSTLGFVLHLAREVFTMLLRAVLPRRLWARGARSRDLDLVAAYLYHRLGYAYYFFRGLIPTVWTVLRFVNVASPHPPSKELGQAFANLGVLLSLAGFYRAAHKYASRSIALRRALGDTWGLGNSLHFLGIILYGEGRYRASIEVLREAIQTLERTGDHWEAVNARTNVAYCQMRLGNTEQAIAEARAVYRDGHVLAEEHFIVHGAEIWAKASGGNLPSEVAAVEIKGSAFDIQRVNSVAQTRAILAMAGGDVETAVTLLSEADARARKSGVTNAHLAAVPIWRVTAARLLIEKTPAHATALRRHLLRDTRRSVRWARIVALTVPGNAPHLLRERAILAAIEGRPRRARRLFDAAVASAVHHEAEVERGLTLLARGVVGRTLGWAGSARDEDEGRAVLCERAVNFSWLEPGLPTTTRGLAVTPAALSEDDQPVTLSLIDRFSTVVDAGRAITVALSPEAVFEALREAATKLLRGDECAVLSVAPLRRAADDNEKRVERTDVKSPFRYEIVAGPLGISVSEQLLRRAVDEKRPVVMGDRAAELANASDSIVLLRCRSALCAPVYVRGEIAACLWIAHRDVSGLFGDVERRLAEFLTTLAGAALENAEGFARVESLSKSLERRVAERTEDLRRSNDELSASLKRLRETQAQLVQSGKMAAVGTLVAGLSHELNNPVGVILGFAQGLLVRLAETDGNRKAIVAIEREARRCAELVRALLDFSRRAPESRTLVSPTTLLERVERIARSQAARKNISLKREVASADLPTVHVNGPEIESALLNILSNAIQASPDASEVTVRVHAVEIEGAPAVEFAVCDRGPGIRDEVLPRIFEPFFTTKPVGQGTGLGLSLARQIVEAHGGEIAVESRVGEGTTLSIRLPATLSAEDRS